MAHKYYFTFYRDGKWYDPACRLVESASDSLEDVTGALKLVFQGQDKYPFTVTQNGNDFHVIDDKTGQERFKVVPFLPELKYKRHKALTK